MSEREERVTVVVECLEGRSERRVTVAELGVALTVANRIVNRLAAPEDAYYRFDTTRHEPDFIRLDIHEVRSGSVVLQTVIDLAQIPFVQGVAGGMLANVLTPHAADAVKSVVGQLRRLGHVGAGKAVKLTIHMYGKVITVITEYGHNGKSRTHVSVYPSDDTQ